MANRGRTYDPQVCSLDDLKRLGSAKLTTTVREYFNEGAMDLITLADNEAAFNRYRIRPRVLRDLTHLDTSTTFMGTKVKFPFGFAPSAMHRLAHPDGEIGTSRAAAAAGIPMGLSCYATTSLEDVIAEAQGNPYVMQLSPLKNKPAMLQMIKRAEAAGYKALFLTLDAPRLGRRLNEYRNNFGLPKGMEYPNLFPGVDVSNLEDAGDQMAYDDIMEWEEFVSFFKKNTKMQVWGKGIYTPADVELAIKAGFDGIVVSNHGGRQLDSVPASLDTLRDLAPHAKGRIPIIMDGGIRRGTDIFKALALGADFCLAARPGLWGLAYNGEQGVKLAIDILYDEFFTCMALAGARNISEITKDHLSLLQPDGVLAKL